MQLNDLKVLVNKSIKKIGNLLRKEKRIKFFRYFLIIIIPIFLVLASIVTYNLSNLFFHLKVKKENVNKNKIENFFNLAEDAYNNGYIENSAVYYQRYLETNPSKINKILTYKKLFAISVLRNHLTEAMVYLDKIQALDKGILEVYINRIKIYLRLNQYQKALNEIVKNQKKFNKSGEFREISGIYYLKVGQYQKALEQFLKIPFRKREYSLHKQIAQTFFYLGEYKKALNYLIPVEKKIKQVADKETLGELILLKCMIKIALQDINDISEELQRARSLSTRYDKFITQLILFANIYLDDAEVVYDQAYNADYTKQDIPILKAVGDYFIYKKDYQKALIFYEKLVEIKKPDQDELMILANLYNYQSDYERSIDCLTTLFKEYNYKEAIIYKDLSHLYGRIQDRQNEIFYLKEGIENHSKDLDLYVRVAKIYLDMGEETLCMRYIRDAKAISADDKNIIYDKRLDLLELMAIQQSKKGFREKDLLDLREKETYTPEYYFKIIQYYLEGHKYREARREFETVLQLPLDEKQKDTMNTYRLIMALAENNTLEYNLAKNNLIKVVDKNEENKINLAILNIIETDYNQALENLTNMELFRPELQNKVLFLQALCYYYKRNYHMALKVVDQVLDKNPYSIKASYLQGLILLKNSSNL